MNTTQTIENAYNFQYKYDLDRKKELAAVYTPETIVQFIVNDTINSYLDKYPVDIGGIKIIDPACGSGLFLLYAIDYLLRKIKGNNPLSNLAKIEVVRSNIFGLDLDPNAVNECHKNIFSHILEHPRDEEIEKLEFVLKKNIKVGNALDVQADLFETEQFYWESEVSGFSKILNNGGFDIVIGNPPYRKIKKITTSQKEFFQETIYGHINLYSLFIHLGIYILREGGFLGYINPQSMMSGLYFKNLRRFIRQHTQLHTLIAFESRTEIFKKVLQSVMIEILEKIKLKSKPEYTVSVGKYYDLRDFIDNYKQRLFEARLNEVFPQINGYSLLCIGTNKIDYQIFRKYFYARDTYPLNSDKIGCKAITGQIVWNRLKPLLSHKPNGCNLPLLKGDYIRRYGFKSKKEHIYLEINDKTKMFIIDKPVIIIGRVTATEQRRRIIAAISKMPSPYFVENHYNIVDGKRPGVDVRYLLAVINSMLTDYIFRKINGSTQVSATEINLFNIKRSDRENEIVSLVDQISNREVTPEEKMKIEEEIDEIIFGIYELFQEERDQIKDFYRSRKNRSRKNGRKLQEAD
ncbi:N-6 DNA methylase [bacterium]|nr:N-6 DNA methylase [bacterium]